MSLNPFNAAAPCCQVSVSAVASTPFKLASASATIRIVNEGPNIAYCAIAPVATPATVPTSTPSTTSTPVLPGADITLAMPPNAPQFFSAIAAGTATLDVQFGEGT